jgi:hypothetical protein
METLPNWRHKTIKSLTAPHAVNTKNAAIALWQPMATQIVDIVGEAGFDSLYARCIYLTQATFPWLTVSAVSPPEENRFASLRASLEGTTPELSSAANSLLLTIFTDTLASLIGEPLTERVLDSAWGNYAQYKGSKE